MEPVTCTARCDLGILATGGQYRDEISCPPVHDDEGVLVPTTDVIELAPSELADGAAYYDWGSIPGAARSEMGGARLGEYVVVAGGASGASSATGALRDVHVFHVPSRVWNGLPQADLPVARTDGVMVGGADTIMMIGGRQDRTSFYTLDALSLVLRWCGNTADAEPVEAEPQ